MTSVKSNLGSTEGRLGHTPEDPAGNLRQTIGDVVRILSVRRGVAFLSFCLAASAAFVATHYIPRTYEASTMFQRQDDPVLANMPEAQGKGLFTNTFRKTFPRDLTNKQTMSNIVDQLGLARDLPRRPDGTLTEAGTRMREAIGTSLAARIRVQWFERGPHLDVVQLTYSGPDPDIMIPLLDELRDSYIRRVGQRIVEYLTQARDWFKQDADDKLEKIETINNELLAWKLAHPGVDPLYPETVVNQLNRQREQLEELEAERQELETRRDAQREIIATGDAQAAQLLAEQNGVGAESSPIIRSPMTVELERKLRQLTTEVASLQAERRMTELHPEIAELRRRQSALKERIKAQQQTDAANSLPHQLLGALMPAASDPSYLAWLPEKTRASVELRTLEALLARKEKEHAKVRARVDKYQTLRHSLLKQRDSVRARQRELGRLEQDYRASQGIADRFDRLLAVENIDRGVNFREIHPARGSMVPVAPKGKTVILLSLLVGAATATVVVILAEILDRRFRTGEQVSRSLGLTMLESIDEIVTSRQRRQRFLRQAVTVPLVTLSLTSVLFVSAVLALLALQKPDMYQRITRWPRSVLRINPARPDTTHATGRTIPQDARKGDPWGA